MFRFDLLRNGLLVGLVSFLACLGGCGQTGALYLPEQPAAGTPEAGSQNSEQEESSPSADD